MIHSYTFNNSIGIIPHIFELKICFSLKIHILSDKFKILLVSFYECVREHLPPDTNKVTQGRMCRHVYPSKHSEQFRQSTFVF